MCFSVLTLSADVQGGATVNFASSDGTATTGDSDYTGVSGTLTFSGTSGTRSEERRVGKERRAGGKETLRETHSSLEAQRDGGAGTPGGTLTIGTATGTGTINIYDSRTLPTSSDRDWN